MSIVNRKFGASPLRPAAQVWLAIINAIALNDTGIKDELNRVTGIAAAIIAERTPESFPITIIGSGSRLRVYCLYDDDAISEDVHEDRLSWNLFESADWQIYFPADESDFEWVNNILKEKGSHFTAYQTGEKIKSEEDASESAIKQLTINIEKLKSNG
jgi:hypothetical protein